MTAVLALAAPLLLVAVAAAVVREFLSEPVDRHARWEDGVFIPEGSDEVPDDPWP